MFEDLIRDYEEKKITGKYIIEQDKEKDYQNYLNNFGSYKL